MNKCKYCEFHYKDKEEHLRHLNQTHISCGVCCEVVFNVGEFDDDYAVCKNCRKKEEDQND